MSTHQNWFRSNIRDRLADPSLDLTLELNPYPFQQMSFHDAADYTAMLIARTHKKIYVSLSGGADSEYTLRSFHRNGIYITPIIIRTSGNSQELAYAFACCEELAYDPIVIDMTEQEFLARYLNIIKTISGYGIYCIPSIVACEYARDSDGILVIGEHLIDTDKMKDSIKPGANEWDFYNECFVGEEYNIPFFNYTVELAHAMISKIEDIPLSIFKAALYGTELRPIMSYEFSVKFAHVRSQINKLRKHYPNSHVDLGSKQEFLNVLQTRENSY
jgi:hypothetical protein